MGRRITTASATASIMIGILIAVVLSLLCNGITAALILNEKLNESIANVVTAVTVFAAVFMGSMIAGKMTDGKIGIICGVVAASFLLLQIGVNIIFFDGAFRGFLKNIISLMGGSGLSCVMLIKGTGRKKRR